MKMQRHHVVQGSPEWHALRNRPMTATASEAPAMMGCSPYLSRTELLNQKKTGIKPEVTDADQYLFDKGHATEAAFRPIAEEMIGDDLYPVTGTRQVGDIIMLASFDGLTMDDRRGFEHKLFNADTAGCIALEGEPPMHHVWQLEHQLLVCGGESIMFATSDGTAEQCETCVYTSRPERREQLLAGWARFFGDLETHVPTVKTVKVEAEVVEALPAVSVRMDGQIIVSSNLDVFGARLRAFVDGLNQRPETDQDFANADAAVKALSKAEAALAAAKASAISQVQAVEQMTTAVDTLISIAKAARLAQEKLVEAQKKAIKTEAVMGSQAALNEHITGLNMRLGRPLMPRIAADFAEAIKGKRTVDTLKAAAADELARAKTEADMMFNRITANLKVIDGTGLPQLFADLVTLVVRDPADVALLVDARVTTHKAAEEKRLEDERAAIRAEEVAKLQREADAKAAADRAEAERLQREANAAAEAAKPAPQPEPQQRTLEDAGTAAIEEQPTEQRPAVVLGVGGSSRGYSVPSGVAIRPAANDVEDDGVRLKLGELNALIAPVSITADGLATLGFPSVATGGTAKLYRDCDVPAIVQAMVRHLNASMTKRLLAA